MEDSDDESEEEDNDEDDDTKIGSLLILGLTSAQRTAPLLSQLSNFRVVGGEFLRSPTTKSVAAAVVVLAVQCGNAAAAAAAAAATVGSDGRGGGMGGENDASSPILNLWRFLAFGGVGKQPTGDVEATAAAAQQQQQRQQRRPLGMCLLSSSDPGAGKSFEARRRAAAAGARYAYLRVNRTLSSVEFAAMLRAQLGTSRKNAKTSARNEKRKKEKRATQARFAEKGEDEASPQTLVHIDIADTVSASF